MNVNNLQSGTAKESLSLDHLARYWATTRPDHRAFVFLGEDNVEREVLTFRELDAYARRLALQLSRRCLSGDRVLLMFPSGLAFVISFFACQYAHVVPVPVVSVRGKRLRDVAHSVAASCQPSLVLTTCEHIDAVLHQLPGLPALAVDFDDMASGKSDQVDEVEMDLLNQRAATDLAFLQYTSGSTSSPRGVKVTHSNLFANLEMQRVALCNPDGVTYVGWTPLHHDMGLIGNVLEPFYVGGLSVLMSPGQFAQSPWLWLRAISDYRARTSGGANFAYDLCVARSQRILSESLDLTCWEVAFNSAEPVRPDTIRHFTDTFAKLGFCAQTMYPCYGMAEATLMISGSTCRRFPVIRSISKSALAAGRAAAPIDDGDRREIVGCGQNLLGQRLAIVDPVTFAPLPDGCIGEIWVHGAHIADGYWDDPEATAETFHAHLHGAEPGVRYLRTGDLGFLLNGELYISGRLKDVMIIRGKNVYPQDVERIAEQSFPGLSINASAAFVISDDIDDTRVVLVQEVERGARRAINVSEATMAIRRAVLAEYEFTLHTVALVEPGLIPRTSSGKIRRRQTRAQFLNGDFSPISTIPRPETYSS